MCLSKRKRFKSVRTPDAENSNKAIDVILGLEENEGRLLRTIFLISGSVRVQRFPVKDERINTLILSYSIGVLNSKAQIPFTFY